VNGFPEKVDVSRPWLSIGPIIRTTMRTTKCSRNPFSDGQRRREVGRQQAACREMVSCRPAIYRQVRTTRFHTVEDVPLTASGRGAEQFHKAMDNTEVFFANSIERPGARCPPGNITICCHTLRRCV